MTITAASSITEVLAAHNDYTATATEIAAWKTATGGVTTTTTSVGLFGADLSGFLTDCAIAVAATACDVTDYADFNGWAIGVNFASSDDANGRTSSVAFTDTK